MQLKKVIEYYGFNTSHITLYQIWESSCNRNTNVSIHLMLLFIGFHWRTVCCKQTVSIHLMLLFIGLLQSNSEPHSPFQYISCYSLSVTGNTYGAKDVRFNTSHVTLYRKTIQYPQYPFCRFQYISCYSLSWSITDNKRLKRVSIHLMLLFIEALLKISGLHIAVSIHLMLLFIFCCWFLWLHIKFVSIHLMLLFIKLHKTL